MWLMTQHGFYSVVKKEDGYHVRARERVDLLPLVVTALGREDVEIVDTPLNDYPYRIVVDQEDLLAITAFLATTVDYDNFKARVDSIPAQKRKPYHQIWKMMKEAIGDDRPWWKKKREMDVEAKRFERGSLYGGVYHVEHEE
jgi:hypothetical protein